MSRQSRKAIEKAYRRVYNIVEGNSLTAKDDAIINHAAVDICRWQGYFPGETNDTDTVNKREMDKKAVTGDISDLCNYFRELGVYNKAEGDWWNIFNLYKSYVQVDPDGSKHPITTGYKDEAESSVTRDDQPTEEKVYEMVNATEANIPLSINNKILQEEKQMAVEGNMTVGEAMGIGLEQAANEARSNAASILGATGAPITTGVGTPSKDDAQKAAQAYAQATEKDRKAYAATNKIQLFLIGQEPLSRRIPANITTGKCADPKAKRDSILAKVWAGEVQPQGMVNGKVNGEYIIPQSVAALNQAQSYIAFMAELEQACENPDHEFEIKKSDKLAPFKGVKLVENGVEKVIKWSDLKTLVYDKTMCQLFVEGSDGVLVQLGKARKDNNKEINSVADLLVLNVVGKNELIDTTTGTIKDNAHVAFVYRTTENVVNDKNGVRSKLSFQYLKKSTSADGKASDRKTNVNLMLQVPQYDVALVSAEYDPLKVSRGVGRTVTKLDPDKQATLMIELFTDAIINNKVDGGLQDEVQKTHSESQAAEAENAQRMAANGQF